VARVCLALAVTFGCEDDPASQITMQPVERPGFDGRQAMAYVETQVAFGPRIPGTEGHQAQLDWMVQTLEPLADNVSVDLFTHTNSKGEALPNRNVLATFEPAEPRSDNRRLLLLAHWDTRPQSDQADTEELREIPVPGANDGASGVAVLMELAHMLAEQPAPITVDLLFVDGEDQGPPVADMFVGSERFANTVPDSLRPAYGILLDMVGDVDPRFPIEGFSAEYALGQAQRVWGVAAQLGYGDWFPVEVGPPIRDDHVPLNEAGIPTINIIDFTYGGDQSPGEYWHTPEDTPDKVSAATLDMVGEVVAEVVYRGG